MTEGFGDARLGELRLLSEIERVGELFALPAPLARVRLRNSETGATLPDVPMLLDCGADVTLIPQASVTAEKNCLMSSARRHVD